MPNASKLAVNLPLAGELRTVATLRPVPWPQPANSQGRKVITGLKRLDAVGSRRTVRCAVDRLQKPEYKSFDSARCCSPLRLLARPAEMYLIQKATSNSTTQGIIPLLTTNISDGGKAQTRNAIDAVVRFLGICLRWAGRQSYRAIVAILRYLRIPDLLDFLFRLVLQILKWCGIGLAIAIGVPITIKIGYWGLRKLLQIYNERSMMRHEERRREEQEALRAACMRELQARRDAAVAAQGEQRLREEREAQARAAAAAAQKEKRLRQEREIQAKLKREEEQRTKDARQKFVMWEEECRTLLRDKSSMTRFPFPPLPRCTDIGCPMLAKSGKAACKHNVEQFFEGSGALSFKLLKRHRHLWHEDRFAACREELRLEFRRLANSLFVAIDPLYENLKAKETK